MIKAVQKSPIRRGNDADVRRAEGKPEIAVPAEDHPGDDAHGQGAQSGGELFVVEKGEDHEENGHSENEVDVVFGEHAGLAGQKEVLLDDQFYALSQKHEPQRELDAPDDGLGEEFGKPVNGAGYRQKEEDGAEQDA